MHTDDGSVIDVKIIEEASNNNHRVPAIQIERLNNNEDHQDQLYE